MIKNLYQILVVIAFGGFILFYFINKQTEIGKNRCLPDGIRVDFTTTIGSNGGFYCFNNDVILDVPKDALKKDFAVSIMEVRLSSSQSKSLDAETFLSKVYKISSNNEGLATKGKGLIFSLPIEAKPKNEKNIISYIGDGENFLPLDAVFDKQNSVFKIELLGIPKELYIVVVESNKGEVISTPIYKMKK